MAQSLNLKRGKSGAQSFGKYRRISQAVANQFAVISAGTSKFQYRNREDKTTLPPNIMVAGSHDVLTNVSGRIGSRKGYTLFGGSGSPGGVRASYDYQTHVGTILHLRAGGDASTGNGVLQFATEDSSPFNGAWYDLEIGLSSVNFNFTDFWDTTNSQSLVLFVNGGASITEWTGGITTVNSVTATTITKNGTTTWAEEGFYPTGTHSVIIQDIGAGTTFQATGGWGTTTLTGLTDTTGITPNSIVYQAPETTTNGSMTDLPLTGNNLIGNLRNQIYVGQFTNRSVYVSQVNNYKDYAFSSPRVVGEGAIITLDGNPTAFMPLDSTMALSAGKDQWYQTQFTLSSDNTKEDFQVTRLKTSSLQGTQSQGLTTKIANYISFVSNEPVVEQLGFVANNLQVPQLLDLSFPIVNDMNDLDFTDGQVIYNKKFIYISVPRESTMLIYNMTDPKDMYWEAPQTLPIGRFSIINGELYGHNYSVNETYKLFDGYNDLGGFINANIVMAFNSHGERPTSKSFNDFYVEGYISANTVLALNLQYDLDGCATQTSFLINGTDTQIVCIGTSDNSLGKYSLGSQPLGSNIDQVTSNTLPPKFRVIKTFNRVPYFEYQVGFSSSGVDQQWEIIAWGPGWSPTSENQANITQ